MLGRYQGYSPLGGEGEHLNHILLGTKMTSPVGSWPLEGISFPGWGEPWSHWILNRNNSASEAYILSVELEGSGFYKIHDNSQ